MQGIKVATRIESSGGKTERIVLSTAPDALNDVPLLKRPAYVMRKADQSISRGSFGVFRSSSITGVTPLLRNPSPEFRWLGFWAESSGGKLMTYLGVYAEKTTFEEGKPKVTGIDMLLRRITRMNELKGDELISQDLAFFEALSGLGQDLDAAIRQRSRS
jgi:hypothetical protein